MAVFFHVEDIKFVYKEKRKSKKWIKDIINSRGFQLGNLNIVFSSKAHLLKFNQEYLNHNYHTDVITFDYSTEKVISGDIFIGVEKVLENSKTLGESFHVELNRVIIHGVLHLLGYDDNIDSKRRIMRKMEDEALNLWNITD